MQLGDDVLDALLGKLDKVTGHGSYWMARCPAHDDGRPSLKIARGATQPVVLTCFAGCATEDILAAVGFTVADISLPREPEPWPDRPPDTAYSYTDEHGEVLFQVVRRPGKEFPQRVPDGRGGWHWGVPKGTRRVIYHLPQVLAAVAAGEPVYVVEGEKDADSAEAKGVTATTNPGGAGKWRSEYDAWFTGAKVIIVADQDEPNEKTGRRPGQDHAANVAAHLRKVARSVVIVHAAEGKDLTDHLEAGHPIADLVKEYGDARHLVLTPASKIRPRPVRWAWDEWGGGRIPAGALGLAAGREGTGKSCWACWLAARVTTGRLPGCLLGEKRRVIIAAREDSWEYTIVPRLIAAGADLDWIYRAEVEQTENEGVSLTLPADGHLLGEAIGERDVALVVFDPLLSAISDSLDSHVNRQVRQALEPLAAMAHRTGCLMLGVAHFSKGSGTDASSLITASGAFKDVARFIFAFASDRNDGLNVITQTKNSLGRSGLPSLAYRVISAAVETDEGEADVGRLVIDGQSDRTVDDILAAQAQRPSGVLDKAVSWLHDFLKDGPRTTGDLEQAWVGEFGPKGLTSTLRRARDALRVKTSKAPDGRWWVALAEHEGDLP